MAVATDIRLQIGFLQNVKVRKVRRALGADAVLSLIQLWIYAAQNQPDGCLATFDDDDLEMAADWPGDPGRFVDECLRLELIERLEDGGFVIHDWAENNPWAAGARERSERGKKAIEKRWEKAAEKQPSKKHPVTPVVYESNTPRSGAVDTPSPSLSVSVPIPRPPPTPPPGEDADPDTSWTLTENEARRRHRDGRVLENREDRPYPHTETLLARWELRAPEHLRPDGRQRARLSRLVLPADLYPLDDLDAVLDAVNRSALLSGRERDAKWPGAGFAWAVEPAHWREILAGKYPASPAAPRAGPPVPVVLQDEAHETTDEDRREAKVATTMLRLAMARKLEPGWEDDEALRAEAEGLAESDGRAA